MIRARRSLLWLLAVPVLYVGALPLVNRVEPVLFGLPFLAVWLLGATLLTPVAVWLAARRDPVWQAGRPVRRSGGSPVDADSPVDGGSTDAGGPAAGSGRPGPDIPGPAR